MPSPDTAVRTRPPPKDEEKDAPKTSAQMIRDRRDARTKAQAQARIGKGR